MCDPVLRCPSGLPGESPPLQRRGKGSLIQASSHPDAGYIYSVLITTVLLVFSWTAHGQIPGYSTTGEQTRLTGSSFGVVGRNATFDYVIVGGGTAGLVVAKRLLEIPGVSVAVIEAGGFYEIDGGNVTQIPGFVGDYTGPEPSTYQPLIDWGLVSTPQQQLGGRKILCASGKCLGGGSARNYLAYQRGTRGSYQTWADNVGDQSYSFDNLLPYFQKSVHFTPPDSTKRGPDSSTHYDATAFNQSGGPLQVSYGNYWSPISTYLRPAFQNLNLSEIDGLNSGRLIGFSEFTVTVDPRAGTRSSSQTSFLQAAITNPQLQVYQRTLARKILFSAHNAATGVSVSSGSLPYTLSARREVILSAGAYRTPQLLMVSGIGPASILKTLQIPVRAPLSGVGQNMQDQPLFGLTYKTNVTTASQLTSNASFYAASVTDFLVNQSGPLSVSGVNVVGWEKLPAPNRQNLSDETKTALSQFPADWPELELLPETGALTPTNDPSANYLTLDVALLTPLSRGNVTINSTDTTQNPLISPNWLSANADRDLAVAAIRRLRQLAAAAPKGFLLEETAPGPTVQTDAEILAFVTQSLGSIHHASAT